MWYRRSWDSKPERYEIKSRDRLKLKLASLTFVELWFDVEGIGHIIPDIDDDWSDARLERDLIDSKMTLALLDALHDDTDWRDLDWREINKERRLGASILVREKVRNGMDRSRLIWKLAVICAKGGCTRPEIMAVVAASNLWQSKYGHRHSAERDLATLADKATRYAHGNR